MRKTVLVLLTCVLAAPAAAETLSTKQPAQTKRLYLDGVPEMRYQRLIKACNADLDMLRYVRCKADVNEMEVETRQLTWDIVTNKDNCDSDCKTRQRAQERAVVNKVEHLLASYPILPGNIVEAAR